MRFDSVVFADSASLAALSCLSRLRSERDAGHQSLLIPIVDASGKDAITARGLGEVRLLEQVEGGVEASTRPFRERLSAVIRRLDPRRVMAPLGLLGAPQVGEYFRILRSTMSVDPGRDLLFFEERPHCLVPEAVALRLSGMGVRLPPASPLRSPRRYTPFALRLLTGFGVPPIFGGLGERARLARRAKTAFKEAADWDCQRALGPKLQPVFEPWRDEDSTELFALALDLGQQARLGSTESFRRRMARHAAGAGSKTPIERSWLSLPGTPDTDPISGVD